MSALVRPSGQATLGAMVSRAELGALLVLAGTTSCFLYVDFDASSGGAAPAGGAPGGASVGAGGEGGAVRGCGDGQTSGSEACDDGNTQDGDGCDSNCTVTACGNGVRSGGEECDDGNQNDDDACTNACLLQNVLYASAQGEIVLVGAGGQAVGGKVAILVKGSPARVCLMSADAVAVVQCPGADCPCQAPTGGWDENGSRLAVGPQGIAFYAPGAADPASPVFLCGPQACGPAPDGITDLPPQIAGLRFAGSLLYGIDPQETVKKLWRLDTEGVSPMFQTAGILPFANGHDIAFSQTSIDVAAVSTTDNPSIIARATRTDLGEGGSVDWTTSPPIDNPAGRPVTLAIPDQDVYFRVNETLGTRTYVDPGSPTRRFPQFDMGDEGGLELEADATSLYFRGGLPGGTLRIQQCKADGSDDCRPITAQIDPGSPFALTADSVFFAVGGTLFRAAK